MFFESLNLRATQPNITFTQKKVYGTLVDEGFEDLLQDFYFEITATLNGITFPTLFVTQYIDHVTEDGIPPLKPNHQTLLLPYDIEVTDMTLCPADIRFQGRVVDGIILSISYRKTFSPHQVSTGTINYPLLALD